MPCDGGTSGPRKVAAGGRKSGSGDELPRLLRDSCIFSSAIREVLNVKLLREVSPHPLTPSQFQVLKLMSFNGHYHLLERFSVSLLSQQPSSDEVCLPCAGFLQTDCPVRQVRGGCRYRQIRDARAREGPAEEAP